MPLRTWLRSTLGRRPPPRSAAPVHRAPPRLTDRSLSDRGLASWSADHLGTLATRVVHPGLVEVDLLTESAAERVRRELAAVRAWCLQTGCRPSPPNSMHEAGAELQPLGLDAWAAGLADAVLAALAAELLPAHAPVPPPDLHAFWVDYGPSGDVDLAQHVDDAAVTVNLWLGGDATGSEVVFEGVRCISHLDVPPGPTEPFVWRGRPGVALIHAGLHRHRTRPVGQGQRDSLIFWLQDPAVRAARFDEADRGPCPPWCGAHRPA